MDRLETKIAKRTAAGKDTSRLGKKLSRAQTSVRQIASMNVPGLDVFNTAETTLGKLQTEQIMRRPGFGGMQGGERVLSPTGHPVSVRGRGGRYRAKFEGLRNRNYFAVPSSARNIDTAADAAMGSRASNSKVTIGRVKDARGNFKYTATLADGSESRIINRSIGSSFFAAEGTVGASGNALASSVGGAVNQSMMGYMRGAQGYLYSGNLTGLAREKALKAQSDLFKVFSGLDDATQATIRGNIGASSVDDIAKRYLPGAGGGPGIGLTATVDDIIAAQADVARAGGNAGRRTLTTESFGVKRDTGRRIGRKQLSHNVPYHASGQDLVKLQQGGLGNMIGKNTELVESTAKQVALTTDVSDNLVRKEATKVAEREFYERSIGAQGKGLLKTFGIKNSAQLMRSSADFRKLAIARGAEGAMRFANPIMTASFVYDISKMASTAIIGGGARMARDAVKSMQGSINKPSFGMGFVDNEVAATSRARGVMAIQNSRLNARSTLGAEASMMSAHFG
jgi:hypothetical protein